MVIICGCVPPYDFETLFPLELSRTRTTHVQWPMTENLQIMITQNYDAGNELTGMPRQKFLAMGHFIWVVRRCDFKML